MILTADCTGKDDAILVNIEVRVGAAPFEQYPVRSDWSRLKGQDLHLIEGSGAIGFSKSGEENRLHFAVIDFKVKLVFS